MFDAQRAAAIIKVLTWEPSSTDYFDLQYQPFIKAGDHLAVPVSVCAASTLSRNLLMKHEVRYDSESADDPVGDRLTAALKERFGSVHREVAYQWTEDGDIDVLVIGKERGFAFECKNTLHPSSSHELRNVYQQITKSVQQLERLRTFYSDPAFREILRQKLQLSDPLPTEITVCTVTGIRTFAGLRLQGVPMRPLWELCNFVSTGIFTLNAETDGDEVELIEFRLWKNKQFNESDLAEALGPDSYWEMRLKAMEEVTHDYELRGKKLVFATYALDTLKIARLMRERYTIVGTGPARAAGDLPPDAK